MKSVLCIDDDADILENLKLVLTGSGFEVLTAENGPDGYHLAQQKKPDAILLDVVMETQTSGFQTAYKIRQDESLRYTPILMLTSVNQQGPMKFSPNTDGPYLPVDRFIEKPFRPDRLVETVNDLFSIPKDEINIGGRSTGAEEQ